MESVAVLVICWFFAGLLITAVSIPLVLGKIPPNRLYGVRTRKTLSNNEVWYKANKYTGKDFLICGLVVSAGALVLWMFKAKLSFSAVSWIGTALLMVPLLVVVVRALSYLKKQ